MRKNQMHTGSSKLIINNLFDKFKCFGKIALFTWLRLKPYNIIKEMKATQKCARSSSNSSIKSLSHWNWLHYTSHFHIFAVVYAGELRENKNSKYSNIFYLIVSLITCRSTLDDSPIIWNYFIMQMRWCGWIR